jgi:hydroxyacylglutathione hydrolase
MASSTVAPPHPAEAVGCARVRPRLSALVADPPEEVAEGVWLVRGGAPVRGFNVFLLRDGEGVVLFDAGVRAMAGALAAAGARLGGITRILLSHGHTDHRGGAALLPGVPVHCHADAVTDTEGDAGARYADLSKFPPPTRWLVPLLWRSWDAGPVRVTDTIAAGDEVGGFRVVDLPGHAPGQVGLWRQSDRLALAADCFFCFDLQRLRTCPPRVAPAAFNFDTAQARESLRELAALEPLTAWPAHGPAVTGDVRGQLERAAAEPPL